LAFQKYRERTLRNVHASYWAESHAPSSLTPTTPSERAREVCEEYALLLEADARRERSAEAELRWRTERDEQRRVNYLPAAGEPGPAALRTPGRLRLPRHQDTSAVLAGHYPFLAEAGLGSSGVFIGQDLYSGGSFVYDPW